ncbi:MAG: hypothetical protein ABEJ03_01730 [Candidatus Nanohaloarchaea archaeon]
MELKTRRGQAFILGGVIFAALFLLAASPSGPSIESGGSSDIRSYFQGAFQAERKLFNDEIGNNRSPEYLKRKIYVYSQFLEQSSGLKGAEFDSYHFLAVPDKEKAIFINYREEEASLTYWNSSKHSFTVGSMQNQVLKIEEDQEINFTVEDLGRSHRIDLTRPRLVYWIKMRRDQQTVQRSYTG